MLLWNEIALDWLCVTMSFGTYSWLAVRMQTCGLVHPPFLAKTTRFDILDFCKTEEVWVGRSIEDHKVQDIKNV